MRRARSGDGHGELLASGYLYGNNDGASGVTPISTVEEGAEAILNLAVSHELDGHSGEFYNGLGPSRVNAQAYDVRARERLRLLSMSLTGLG